MITKRGRILKAVMAHMLWQKDKAIVWYKTKNPMFGGVTPQQMVIIGRHEKVFKMIEALIGGEL